MSADKSRISLCNGWLIQSSAQVKEDGSAVSSSTFSPVDWYPAVVPSTILAALVNNGVYPDPYFGTNLKDVQHEPFEVPWWYRTEFGLPDDCKGKNIRLHFDGINYRADVWLNGQKLADSKQMVGTYLSFEFDISDKVLFGRNNVLGVKVFPPTVDNLGITWYDWGPWPPDLNMGLWQSIYINASKCVEIKHPHVVTDLPLPDISPARITVSSDIVNHLGTSQSGTLRATIFPRNYPKESIVLEKKVKIAPMERIETSFTPDEFPQLKIENPRLWWPVNYGEQSLYELRLEFIANNEILDTEETSFGIREISSYLTKAPALPAAVKRFFSLLNRAKSVFASVNILLWKAVGIVLGAFKFDISDKYIGPIWLSEYPYISTGAQYWAPTVLAYLAPESIASYISMTISSSYTDKFEGNRVFEINGKRILIRGANWTDDLLLRSSRERYTQEIGYFKDMNLNAIRLEGNIAADLDYLLDLADEEGLLVFLGWHCGWEHGAFYNWNKNCPALVGSLYLKNMEKAPNNMDLAVAYSKDAILRYRNHASFIAWLVGSDMAAPEKVEKAQIKLFAEHDGTRPVISYAAGKGDKTTPAGDPGWIMGGPYWKFERPEYYYDMTKAFSAHGFNTEGGPNPYNIPPVESIKKMLPPDHWWPIDEYWLYHLARPQIAKADLSKMTKTIEYSYGKAISLEDYSAKAQLLQYETNRAMFESWGKNKYAATGILSWKGKSQWSSLQWQMYDVYLMPGGAYFGTKKGNEPLHVQYSYDNASIYVVNNYLKPYEGLEVDATVYTYDMRVAYHNSAKISVAPDGVKQAFTIPEISGLSEVYFLKLELKDSTEKIITSNFYWLTTKKSADMFAKLSELAKVNLEVSSSIEKDSSKYTVHIDLHNQSPYLAFAVAPKIARGSAKELVLPIIWEDSYFSLLPGESKTVTASFDEKSLNGEKTWLTVEGWNIIKTEFELKN